MRPARVHPVPRCLTRTRVLAAATLAATALAVVPAGVASGQDGADACEQPYSPVAFARTYPQQEELPTVDATPVSRPVLPPGPFDSDGDGVDDTVTGGAGQVTIGRGDGDVVLTAPGASSASAYGVGDVDGDGRDEFVVRGTDAAPPNDRSFLIPGTVPTGTSSFADAGIDVARAEEGLVPVGDEAGQVLIVSINGDGSAGTDFWDGETLLVPGPGGSTGTLRPYFASSGEPVAFADQEGLRDRILLVQDHDDHTELSYVADRVGFAHLTTLPEPYVPNYVGPGAVEVLDGDDGTFVRLTQDDRSGSAAYLWSLDDPCTSLETDGRPDDPVPAAPDAPAARPITTTATFTG